MLLWDERWSTVAVERTMIEADMSRARRAEKIDAHAAAHILQARDRRAVASAALKLGRALMDLLSIDGLSDADIAAILDEGERWFAYNRQPRRNDHRLDGLTIVNAFFENSTRTLLSFEIAANRLGAQVVTMQVEHSSIKKGETLEDTARTLNAMRPDALVIRHGTSGAPADVAAIMDCPVINAGDGTGEHPTQALARRRDDPPAFRADRGAQDRDLRRHPPQPRRPLERHAARAASAPTCASPGRPRCCPTSCRRRATSTRPSPAPTW